jgi:glycosyltransferase involved in cell wall biosynthesis
MTQRRVLVLSFDPLTSTMPGPAIRAWNLALQLARDHRVTLAGTAGADRTHPAMDVRSARPGGIRELVQASDVVFAPTSVVRRHPEVVSAGVPLCIDMYDPTHLENLEAVGHPGGPEHVAAVAHQVSVIEDDLRHGDFFLCASERQRDFWMGSLAALGRVNPANYEADPSLRRLLAVVPFGVETAAPIGEKGLLRRVFPVIGAQDPVLIWGGGVYNWFDPVSLVHAVDILRRTEPAVRLVFLGMRHPNPEIPEMRVATELRETSDRLGLTDQHVFFNTGWVPYDERGAYLLDADIGVSTHLEHVETRFSFRTRVLDYLWVGLPTVLTRGDTLSDEIDAAGVGRAVPPGDAAAIAAAVRQLLESPPGRMEIQRFAARYSWDQVARPLVDYCRAPWRAADAPDVTRGAEGPGR